MTLAFKRTLGYIVSLIASVYLVGKKQALHSKRNHLEAGIYWWKWWCVGSLRDELVSAASDKNSTTTFHCNGQSRLLIFMFSINISLL